MAKLKMPSKELGTEQSPVSPGQDPVNEDLGGQQEPSDLIGGTNTSETAQVDVTGPDLTEDEIEVSSVKTTEAFNCYYSGQFLSFKEGEEITDEMLIQYLIDSGAAIEADEEVE